MTLFKNDCVKLTNEKTGECTFWRIAGYSAGQNKLDIQPNLQAGKSQQNFKSINVLFNKFMGSPDNSIPHPVE